MSPVGITIALCVALGAFAVLAWRKLAVVFALAPEVRWDEPMTRLRRLVRNGFLQSRMIRGDRVPGVAHAAIFGGFLLLLARKVELVAVGFDDRFAYGGVAGGAFAFAKDIVELVVLAAVSYGLARRFVRRPQRLEPNREALVILSLIATIMVTDFAFDALRFARLGAEDAGIAHEASWAPIGGALAGLVTAWPASTLDIAMQVAYWTQMLTVLAFLVVLPLGEHFHIVTALPALFFARGRPANVVPCVDLDAAMSDAADDVRVGVKTAADLVWKDALDAFTCTECGRCKVACPTFLTGKPLALKWVNDSLKHHLMDQRDAIVHRAADRDDALPAIVPGVISEDALWACTTCGYCEAACPIELEHLPKFYRLRQQRVMMEGAFPHELNALFDAYESQGNPWALPAETRGDWAKALDVPIVETAEDVRNVDWLYYVGSAASFDPRGRRVATAFVRAMQRAGVRIGILGAREGSTGECVRRLGNEMLFQSLARSLVDTLNGLGVTRIVTTDPHAFNSLRNEYPAFGGRYEVVHHTQLLAQLHDQGRLPIVPAVERVVFHDPCYLARHNGEVDAPRRLVEAVSRDAPREFALCGERAMCCGAGGGRMWQEERLGSRINVERARQALATGAGIIATGCPYCATMLEDGLKALGREDVAVRDVAELCAPA